MGEESKGKGERTMQRAVGEKGVWKRGEGNVRERLGEEREVVCGDGKGNRQRTGKVERGKGWRRRVRRKR